MGKNAADLLVQFLLLLWPIVIPSEGGLPRVFGVPGTPGVGVLGQSVGNPSRGILVLIVAATTILKLL